MFAMCTGFACYIGRPLYAMNFDCWEVPMRMRLSRERDKQVLWFEADMGGKYLETAAMNSAGFFGNFQGNLSAKHKNIEPGPGTVTIADIYKDSLQNSGQIADLKNMIGSRTVAYPPVPPEWNLLHNLFADRYGSSLVLETSEGCNEITEIHGNYQVMTNFPVNEFRNAQLNDVAGAGDDRYKLACQYLAGHETVGVNEAFEVLAKTAQNTDGWKTLCSMVFDPIELKVYFALNQQFGDTFTIDMTNHNLIPSVAEVCLNSGLSLAGLTK